MLVEAAANVLQSNRHAPATVRTRSAQLRAYDQFVGELGIVAFPPTPEDVKLFAAWLMLNKCTRETSLRQYLSALKTHFALLNLWVPAPREYGPLAAVVEGSKRMFPGPIRRSLPVTVAILRNLVFSRPPAAANARLRTVLQVLVDAMIILFFSMLRSSSLFPPSASEADPARNLVWERVRFSTNGAVISVVLAKTNQFCNRVHQVALAEKVGSPFCPVAALRRLRALRPEAAGNEHVFQLPTSNGGWRLLVKTEVNVWFKSRIAEMGLDPEKYMLHGHRHGAVALALASEPNLALVKLQSDHLSDSIWTYAQVELSKRQSVAAVMLDAVDLFVPPRPAGHRHL